MELDTRVEGALKKVSELAPLVRSQAATAEVTSRPTDELVGALHEAGLFNLMIPADRGGPGYSTRELAPVIEALSRIDGSAGWTLALGQGLMVGRLAPEVARELCQQDRLMVAGTLNPMQSRVTEVDGGYLFKGVGTYASNATHATHVVVAGLVFGPDGKLIMTATGPSILAGILPRANCEVLDTWAMTGMRGTGSHDVRFEGTVPERHTMQLGDALANLGGLLTPVSLGIAQHAIDAFIELAGSKRPTGSINLLRDRVTAQDQLGRGAGLLQAGRSCFYEGMRVEEERERSGRTASNQDRVQLRLAAMMGAQLAADAVNIIFDASGMTGAAQGTDIERCWRDVNVVRQHITLASARYEVVGRVLLGLEPGSPLI